MIEENIELEKIDEELLAKRARMKTAIKGLAGWVSYLMGNGALAIGLFNPFGLEWMSISIGVFISCLSIYLIVSHVIGKQLKDKGLIVKLIKTLGGLSFFPGFVFTRILTEKSPLYNSFYSALILGVVLTILGSILRKVWKLNKKLQPIE